jgi:hypothetical protein
VSLAQKGRSPDWLRRLFGRQLSKGKGLNLRVLRPDTGSSINIQNGKFSLPEKKTAKFRENRHPTDRLAAFKANLRKDIILLVAKTCILTGS